ncbi:hypothetical protein LCGC14_0404290 [marine sediment metagenome]|uniref:Uncharacterized protein n=1 Tax=marine sediment metagenome TaxID=412755 RepID=A0A0F9SVZ5_9ZZZZ
MTRKRVKCANCGMIHDVYVGTCFIQSCPSCGSNAYDAIEKKPCYQEREDWK